MSLVTVHYLSMMVDAAKTTVPAVTPGSSASFAFVRLPVSTEVVIDWGDGSTDTTVTTNGSGATTQSHTYAAAGNYIVTVTAAAVVVESFEVAVPAIITPAADIVAGIVSATFTFTLEASSAYTLDWGDGNTEALATNASGADTATHTYAVGGSYTVTVKDEYLTPVTSVEVEVEESFRLTYSGQQTAPIPFTATAATVDTALTALSNIGPTDVAVTGDAGGPYSVEFTSDLAETNVAQLTATATAGTVTIATATPGGTGVNEVQTITLP